MSAAKHTPGPWMLVMPAKKDVPIIVTNDAEWPIADVFTDGIDESNGPSNARLIAAAPDLLGAIRFAATAMVADEKDVRDFKRLCRAILARIDTSPAQGLER